MSEKPLVLSARARVVDNAPLVVASLLLFDSLHFVFARLLLPYLPPATGAMYVLGIATLEVTVFLLIWDRIHFDVFRRHLWFFLSIGFLVAGSTFLTFWAVAFIDPGTASLLGKSSILFGVGLGLVWLQERLAWLEGTGGLLAIGGLFIIVFQPGDYLRFGSLLVLLSALMYSLHAAIVKRYSGEIGLADFFLFRLAATTGFLLLLVASRAEWVWPSWQGWLVVLLTATVNIVVSRTLYYLALRRLKLSMHSIVLTLSPAVTIGWTLMLFNIIPTFQQLLGGVAVIVGILLVVVSKTQGRRAQ